MVTMLLGGLWHGADWKFVIWGGLHGTYLVGERVVTRGGATGRRAGRRPALAAVGRWLLTFNLVCLAWVFFRADSTGAALEIIGRILTAAAGSATLITGLALATIAAALAVQLLPRRSADGLRAQFAPSTPHCRPWCSPRA